MIFRPCHLPSAQSRGLSWAEGGGGGGAEGPAEVSAVCEQVIYGSKVWPVAHSDPTLRYTTDTSILHICLGPNDMQSLWHEFHIVQPFAYS